MTAAIMFPIAESACSEPSAMGRLRSDMTSATSETLTASCAADSQARQESIDREVPDPRGEGTQAREGGVAQDGQDHRLDAADLVAEDAEDDPPRRPAEQEDRRRIARVLIDQARLRRVAGLDMQQAADRRDPGQVEELLVHRVEEPPQRRDEEHEPLVSRQVLPPGARCAGAGEEGVASLKCIARLSGP